MYTLAEIKAKSDLAIAAHESGDIATAIKYLDSAINMVQMTPDREFDGQRVEFRERQRSLLELRDRWKKDLLAASNRGKLTHIPVYRLPPVSSE